jgi:hypothetical protein
MAFTNDVIVSNFIYLVLTKLGTGNTDPTFATLQVVQVELKINTDYALHSIGNAAFGPPTNPPDVPVHA